MTVHKQFRQYGEDVTLADTPSTWVEGPSISTLSTLAIFVGIPLLVIVAISLLVYAPSWVHGPRYRPGQPWDSRSEWFGVSAAAEPATGPLEGGSDAVPNRSGSVGSAGADPDATSGAAGHPRRQPGPGGSGGASAGW